MMKKQFGLLLLIILFGSSSSFVFSRGGSNPSVTVVPTITHGTCFNPNGIVIYEVVVSSEWENEATMNRLDLFNDVGESIYPHPDESLLGTVNNVGIGVYIISGSVTALSNDGMWVGIPFSMTIWVGIQTVWSEKIDMVSAPNSYSAKRNASTASYGGVRSSNGITSGDGWIEMSAVYGSTTDNRVFWIIGNTDPLGNFDPTSDIQYIEFFKGSAGNGIRLKYQDIGGTYMFSTLSTNQNDKIRLVRNGSTLTIQKNNTNSAIAVLPVGYAGPMNIAVRTLAEEDGCLDVVSTFDCSPIESDLYGHLKYKLDGFYHIMKNGHIKFVFDQEYDADDLIFNIYNQNDLLVKTNLDFPALNTTNGDDYLTIDVSSSGYCIGRGFFYLEVVNSKKEKLYLRFFNDYTSTNCVDYIDANESND